MDQTVDRVALGEFLRAWRESLQPGDVGLYRGARRRTQGLRREEVAELCGMSADYVARLERSSGPGRRSRWPLPSPAGCD
jgi:Helix-turn-helix domain